MSVETVLLALGNEYNAAILGATDEPRSAQDLSETLDIPIATCYRRIEELTEADLLERDDRVLSDDRRRVSVYRRTVDRIVVDFDDDSYAVAIDDRADPRNTPEEAWRSLPSP